MHKLKLMGNKKKNQLIVSIAFTIFGFFSAILLVVLDCTKRFDTKAESYVLMAFYFLLVWAPQIVEIIIKKEINLSLIICYDIFITLSVLVGSMWGVYKKPIYFDKFTHFLSGVLWCFAFYNLFGEKKADDIGKVWLVLITFFVSMAIGGFWEICEFTLDSILGGDTQRWQTFVGREVLFDTMFDLIVDFVGAIIGAALVLVVHNKKHKKVENPA